jgi:hypothetical protein
MLASFVGILGVTGALIVAANAEAGKNFRVGNWLVGAYSDSARKFSHCAGSTSYRSGILVVFAVTKNYLWSMSFMNPSWRLSQGETYDISFVVDSGQIKRGKAFAVSVNQVNVLLPDSTELFGEFQRGNTLRVATEASEVMTFNLTDTSKLLPALLTCVQTETTLATGGANPFVKSTKAVDRRESDRAEATAMAANILSAAGMKNFYILPPDEAAKKGVLADVVWGSDGVAGTVNIISASPAQNPEEVTPLLVAADARSCKGAFFSGVLPAEGDKTGRVYTSCQMGLKTTASYHLAIPRTKGGFYVFSTVSSGAEQPAKEADANIRSAVFSTRR